MNKWYPVALIILATSWLTPLAPLTASRQRFLPRQTASLWGELPALRHPRLVDRFYVQNHSRLFWFAPDAVAAEGRRQLLMAIDSAAWRGLDSNAYLPGELRRLQPPSAGSSVDEPCADTFLMSADRWYTDAALSLGLDNWRGAGIDSNFSYDGISPKYAARDEEQLPDDLAVQEPDHFRRWLDSLEPDSRGYDTLKTVLSSYIGSGNTTRMRQLVTTINAFRFIHHFGFARFIIVNIPSATLRYYAADTLTLQMRIVAGQTSKRTPRFAAWCKGLVLYPYWNIPRRIAVTEMLPLFKKAPGLATFMDIQVLDAKGRIIDSTRVDWKAWHAADFPYTLRQAPGCQNALGVLKFELSDPFNVYMHDTNLKRAFGAGYRYLSHGCIRLEKPAQLGDLLLDHRLDTTSLNACLKDEKPSTIALASPVPVFVVYLTVIPDATGRLIWLKDIYHLLH